MRSIAVGVFLALFVTAACQKEQAAAPAPAPKSEVVAAATVAAPAPAAPAAEPMCGGGECNKDKEEACTGMGNGQCCGGAVAEAAPAVDVPADAVWTELTVTGMHCGNCARKIERTLRDVEGVVAVTVDQPTGLVRVASAACAGDLRAVVTPKIDALGYHVTR